MTKNERYSLASQLATLQKRAEDIEDEVCGLLNSLAAELIPTTPELTDEAAHHLKNGSLRALSGAVDAVTEVLSE